ncbi:hypothetical protein EI42_02674 [Thermosporothrix hazakensis]|uniref:Butirosin biosynthesis protein H-like n=2 Tax=Thermosporothrix TaxID=768650 RepID=A0A326U601_THEHA|nr:hypothetical protein EI42_02674 [Thermosporothrix hazakensis]
MLPYVGSGDYCYSNSLHMALRGSGAASEEVPLPGFLECLTTMPFGHAFLKRGETVQFFFDGLDPHRGLTRAIETLGWTCQLTQGGDEQAALERLALAKGPILVGPVDMGYLTYNPNAAYARGADHFVIVLAVEQDIVLLHDPKGYPCVPLDLKAFLQAWKAKAIAYTQEPFIMRSDFVRVRQPGRQEMIAQTLPLLAENVRDDPGGPQVYGSVRAIRLFADYLRAGAHPGLCGELIYFAFPLAARRMLDAVSFLQEGGLNELAGLFEQKARLFGQAQAVAVRKQWHAVAELMDRLAALEERVLAVLP